MVALLGVYFCISLIVALPFIARYLIVSFRESRGGHAPSVFAASADLHPLINHFEQKFLQRF